MRLNSAGTSINTSLYVSGLTTFNNIITCLSSLNVSGVTTLSGNTYHTGSMGINASSLLSRLTLRMSYNDGNTGGLCLDSADAVSYTHLTLPTNREV